MAVTGKQDLIARKRVVRKRRRKISLFIFLFVLVGLIGLFFYLANHERLAIKEITIYGNKTLNNESLLVATREVLAGRYLGLIRRDNFLFYPRKELTLALKQKFDKLATLDLTASYDGQLTLFITEREARVLWCLELAAPCVYLDQTGLAFSPAPQFSGPVMLTVLASRVATLNSFPLSAGDFAHLLSFATRLPPVLPKSLMARPIAYRASLLPEGDLELWLKGVGENLANPIRLRLNLADDPAQLESSLQSAFGVTNFLEEVRSRRADLEYLDLRFADKVFYKFRED